MMKQVPDYPPIKTPISFSAILLEVLKQNYRRWATSLNRLIPDTPMLIPAYAGHSTGIALGDVSALPGKRPGGCDRVEVERITSFLNNSAQVSL